MSKKSLASLYSNLLYKMGQDFLNIQYEKVHIFKRSEWVKIKSFSKNLTELLKMEVRRFYYVYKCSPLYGKIEKRKGDSCILRDFLPRQNGPIFVALIYIWLQMFPFFSSCLFLLRGKTIWNWYGTRYILPNF